MKNKPYIAEVDEFGKVTNLSKEQPFINKYPKQPKKNAEIYLLLQNGMKVKNFGNNRANKSKRKGKHSRLHQNFTK